MACSEIHLAGDMVCDGKVNINQINLLYGRTRCLQLCRWDVVSASKRRTCVIELNLMFAYDAILDGGCRLGEPQTHRPMPRAAHRDLALEGEMPINPSSHPRQKTYHRHFEALALFTLREG